MTNIGNTNSPPTALTSCLHDDDTIARIALACAGVSGDPTVAVAIQTLGGALPFVAAVHDGRDAAAALSVSTRHRIRQFATVGNVVPVLAAMVTNRLTVITPLNTEWPHQVECLRRAAPLILWARGDVAVLGTPSIAVTGQSVPTEFGTHMTLELATGLADRGWVIAASDSTGLDELALDAARAMGGGTITATSVGLDRTMSDEHPVCGVEVSEVPPTCGVTVRGQHRAAHLLAALASKMIVVEAGESGSAVRTGEAAHAMGRPVGVVPVTANGAHVAGCRRLTRLDDVALISSITDADRLR